MSFEVPFPTHPCPKCGYSTPLEGLCAVCSENEAKKEA